VFGLRPSTGTVSRLSAIKSRKFSFVPIDGYFGVNRTLPGFSGLGDVSLRVRPAKVQSITLPPVPYLQEFPLYTTISTATAAAGKVSLKSPVSCALLCPLCSAVSCVVALTCIADIMLVEVPKKPWETVVHDITAQLSLPSDAKMRLLRYHNPRKPM